MLFSAGAIFKTCQKCSKLGKLITSKIHSTKISSVSSPKIRIPLSTPKRNYTSVQFSEPEVDLVNGFSHLIRQARERMGISQEELGQKTNEKPSVIRLVESGRLKPNDILIRKLERFLKIKLLVTPEE